MSGWEVPPERKSTYSRPKHEPRTITKHVSMADDDYAIPTEEQLASKTKTELIEEVMRLQKLVREIAVELGLARRCPSSECVIDMHFVGHIQTIVKGNWRYKL